MAAREFAEYKYNSGIRNRAGGYYTLALVTGLAVVIVAVNAHPAALAALVIPVAIAIVAAATGGAANVMIIGSRYLIVGPTVVYYANIRTVKLDRERRTLSMATGDGRALTIRADRFPTNARKPDKIAKNINAKFDKAVEKICARLQERCPAALA